MNRPGAAAEEQNPRHNHMLMMRILGPVINFVNRPWKVLANPWQSQLGMLIHLDVSSGCALRIWLRYSIVDSAPRSLGSGPPEVGRQGDPFELHLDLARRRITQESHQELTILRSFSPPAWP